MRVLLTLLVLTVLIMPATVSAKTYKKRTYKKATYSTACSCVNFVRAHSRARVGSVGYARNWPVNSRTPKVGGVVVTRESRAGHVALITHVGNGYIVVKEANYRPCAITSGRKIPINSSLIKGFYNT